MFGNHLIVGAGEGIRTLDPDLGKVVHQEFPGITSHGSGELTC
jgi:hypothetical protein